MHQWELITNALDLSDKEKYLRNNDSEKGRFRGGFPPVYRGLLKYTEMYKRKSIYPVK